MCVWLYVEQANGIFSGITCSAPCVKIIFRDYAFGHLESRRYWWCKQKVTAELALPFTESIKSKPVPVAVGINVFMLTSRRHSLKEKSVTVLYVSVAVLLCLFGKRVGLS